MNDLGFLKVLKDIALNTQVALRENPPNIQLAIANNNALILDLESIILLETESNKK